MESNKTEKSKKWLNFDWILAAFWLNFNCILTVFWQNFDCFLTGFWLDFDWILAAFWLNFDWILTAFFLTFDCNLWYIFVHFWRCSFFTWEMVKFRWIMLKMQGMARRNNAFFCKCRNHRWFSCCRRVLSMTHTANHERQHFPSAVRDGALPRFKNFSSRKLISWSLGILQEAPLSNWKVRSPIKTTFLLSSRFLPMPTPSRSRTSCHTSSSQRVFFSN